MKPTREAKRAATEALQDWIVWETFDHNFLYDGGLLEQENEWLDAIAAVSAASNKAEDFIQAEQQAMQEAEQKRAAKRK